MAFSGQQVRLHSGWIDEDLLAKLRDDSVQQEAVDASSTHPMQQAVLSAGSALRSLASHRGDPELPFGWEADLDAPRWALNKNGNSAWLPSLVVALLAGVLAAGLLGVL